MARGHLAVGAAGVDGTGLQSGGVYVYASRTSRTLPQHLGRKAGHLESRAKATARLDLEASAGSASPCSRGLWGGDALLLSASAAGS
jgi:hypothetical protein